MLVEHGLELQDRERLDRHIGSISLGSDKLVTKFTGTDERVTVKFKMLLKDGYSKIQDTQVCFQDKSSQERPWLFRNGPGNKQQKTRDPQTFIG